MRWCCTRREHWRQWRHPEEIPVLVVRPEQELQRSEWRRLVGHAVLVMALSLQLCFCGVAFFDTPQKQRVLSAWLPATAGQLRRSCAEQQLLAYLACETEPLEWQVVDTEFLNNFPHRAGEVYCGAKIELGSSDAGITILCVLHNGISYSPPLPAPLALQLLIGLVLHSVICTIMDPYSSFEETSGWPREQQELLPPMLELYVGIVCKGGALHHLFPLTWDGLMALSQALVVQPSCDTRPAPLTQQQLLQLVAEGPHRTAVMQRLRAQPGRQLLQGMVFVLAQRNIAITSTWLLLHHISWQLELGAQHWTRLAGQVPEVPAADEESEHPTPESDQPTPESEQPTPSFAPASPELGEGGFLLTSPGRCGCTRSAGTVWTLRMQPTEIRETACAYQR